MKSKSIDTYECRIYIGSIYEDTKAPFYDRGLNKYNIEYPKIVFAFLELNLFFL